MKNENEMFARAIFAFRIHFLPEAFNTSQKIFLATPLPLELHAEKISSHLEKLDKAVRMVDGCNIRGHGIRG